MKHIIDKGEKIFGEVGDIIDPIERYTFFENLDKWNKIKYQHQRQQEYPKIGDQLDALYHYFEASNITNDFTDMIKVVKDQFPKPTV